jgi:DNA recombination protein RmuC
MIDTALPVALPLAIGIVLGVALAWVLGVRTAQRERDAALRNGASVQAELAAAQATLAVVQEERLRTEKLVTIAAEAAVDRSEKRLGEAAKVQRATDNATIETTVAPLKTTIEALAAQLGTLQKDRAAEAATWRTTLDGFKDQNAALRDAADRVSRVFTSSPARGSWGEYELRRLVESQGMSPYVSFDEQVSGYGGNGKRPDAVVTLFTGQTVPIDSKVPIDRYQEALDATDDAVRSAKLDLAADAIFQYGRDLGKRRYHDAPGCVGWTLMFIPIESMLAAVLSRKPDIVVRLAEDKVVVCSPHTLMLYLHALARGWAAQSREENAERILDLSKTLVERLEIFARHLIKVGDGLEGAVSSYNSAVGSFDKRLAPTAREIHELGAAEQLSILPALPTPVERPDLTRLPAGSLD